MRGHIFDWPAVPKRYYNEAGRLMAEQDKAILDDRHGRLRRAIESMLSRLGSESEEIEDVEAQMQDVVGLKVPRKPILATLNIDVKVGNLPRRRPHVTFERDTQ